MSKAMHWRALTTLDLPVVEAIAAAVHPAFPEDIAIFAERQEGKLTLRRGFSLSPADRVLVVEDVITTGGSTRETIDVAAAAGGTVVGASAIINRGRSETTIGLPFYALVNMEVPVYQPETCPLCAKGDPVVKPGSRGLQ